MTFRALGGSTIVWKLTADEASKRTGERHLLEAWGAVADVVAGGRLEFVGAGEAAVVEGTSQLAAVQLRRGRPPGTAGHRTHREAAAGDPGCPSNVSATSAVGFDGSVGSIEMLGGVSSILIAHRAAPAVRNALRIDRLIGRGTGCRVGSQSRPGHPGRRIRLRSRAIHATSKRPDAAGAGVRSRVERYGMVHPTHSGWDSLSIRERDAHRLVVDA